MIKWIEHKKIIESEGMASYNEHFQQMLVDGYITEQEFSVRECAEEFLGRDTVRALHAGESLSILTEAAGDAVDSTAFSNITSNLIRNRILADYQQEAFFCSGLMNTRPTRQREGTVPGVGNLDGHDGEIVEEGMPYQSAGYGERFTGRPRVEKRGKIVPVTRETIIFDETGVVLDRARKVGQNVGTEKEERCLRVVLGVTNTFTENGTAFNTYGSALFTPDNDNGSNELVDWTDIENSDLLFSRRIDPDTTKPILIGVRNTLVMPAKAKTALSIINATEIRQTSGTIQTLSSNPVLGTPSPQSSALMRQIALELTGITNTDDIWIHGDIRQAFGYDEAWAITVVQEPMNSQASFEKDIVFRVKASEMGVAFILDPRYVNRNFSS